MTATVEKLLEELAPVIERLVCSQVERVVRQTLLSIAPRDGRDGQPGAAGPPGERGAPGEQGAAGPPGRDGTLEAVRFERLGRTITVRREDGTALGAWTTEELQYQGFYRKGAAFEPGDTVSYAGSLWVCASATSEKPSEDSPAWTLAVRRGEQGKKGEPGPRGPAGDRGEQGLPGVRY